MDEKRDNAEPREKADKTAERIEAALGSSDPAVALDAMAVALRDEGMGQKELYDRYFAVLQRYDQDEPIWDAIADAMDRIVGWCNTRNRLFPTYYNPK